MKKVNSVNVQGASTPVKYYKDNNKILPYFGATRIGKIRLKKV